jgi:hypothetical protein
MLNLLVSDVNELLLDEVEFYFYPLYVNHFSFSLMSFLSLSLEVVIGPQSLGF